MSFYTIQTPGNRNEEVKIYLQLREYLRAKDSIDKTGYYTKKKELSKMFRPISKPLEKLQADVKTLPQEIGKATGEEFGKVLQTMPALQALPPPPDVDLLGSLPADVSGLPYAGAPPEIEKEKEKEKSLNVNITDNEEIDLMLMTRGNKEKYKDHFYFNPITKTFKLGNKDITFSKNKIEYEGKQYKTTPALVDFITSTKDDLNKESINDRQAVEDYKEILKDSNTFYQFTKDGKLTPNEKLKKMDKYTLLNLKNEVYEKEKENIKKQYGKGIKQTNKNKNTVFLSSDPNALADRLALLCAGLKAGNTSLNNEVVDICNELIRMGAMSRQQKNKILKHFKPY